MRLGSTFLFSAGYCRRRAHFSRRLEPFDLPSCAPASVITFPMARLSWSPEGAAGPLAKSVPVFMMGRIGQPHGFVGLGPIGISPLLIFIPGQLGPCSAGLLLSAAKLPG